MEVLRKRVYGRIRANGSNVFLREDFSDLGGYDQVGRALRELRQKGRLVKLGYGLYAKARKSQLTGQPVPVEPMNVLAAESMEKLGVKVQLGKALRDYQAGQSTQIPARPIFNIGSARIQRKIGFNNISVGYERAPG